MRTVVSSSFFGFVSLAAVALAGCSLEREAPVPVEAPAAADDGSKGAASFGIADPELGPVANVPGQPTAIGQACSSDAECESGSCADGVCCDTACDGACEACNVPDFVGFCVAHAAGTDPEQECGGSACEYGVAESFSCDGAGACQVQIDSCGNYACGATACQTECRSDADCAATAHCNGDRCESK